VIRQLAWLYGDDSAPPASGGTDSLHPFPLREGRLVADVENASSGAGIGDRSAIAAATLPT
jgi:hypothetical protein